MAEEVHMCSCGSHAAFVKGDPEDEVVYVAAFRYGKTGKVSPLERLKWAYKILTTGEPFEPEYTFCPDDAVRFAKGILAAAQDAGGEAVKTRGIGFSGAS